VFEPGWKVFLDIKIHYCRSRSRSVCCPAKNGREMM